DCTAKIEDSPPGNYDRFSFEDPATQLRGFKTGTGAVAIAPRFKFAYEFGKGGVAAAVDKTMGFVFIDTRGRVIARAFPDDNGPAYSQEGVARIVDARGKIGFVTNRGEMVVPPTYDHAEPFCHDRAEVVVDGATFVIDR